MKKQTFELDLKSRDQQLLIFLVLIMIAFTSYFFVISPSLDKGSTLKTEVMSIQNNIAVANDLIAKIPELKANEREKRNLLLEKYKTFFYELNGERILYQLDSIMAATGFQVTAYSTTNPIASPISFQKMDYKALSFPLLELARKSNPSLVKVEASQPAVTDSARNGSNANPDQLPADSVANMELKLQFTGSGYVNMMAFIKSLENLNKSVIVKNISIVKSTAGAGLDGEIILELYSLPKVGDDEATYLEFKPVIPLGKMNPFQ